MDRHRAALTGALLLVPAAFLAVFFVFPVATLVATGLGDGGSFDPGAVAEVVGSPSVRAVAWFTTWQAAASTALTLVCALPAAWVLGRISFPGRRWYAAGLVVPFVLPTVVVGVAFLALLGPDGPPATVAGWFGHDLDLRRTTTAVLAAHVFFNFAVVARTVGAAWAAVDPSAEDAARTLGARPIQVFARVVWPRLAPAVGGSTAIVFLFCFTSFGVIKVLGGARLATLEVEIHRYTTELLDLRTAAVLSLLQMSAVVASLALYRTTGGGRTVAPVRSGDSVLRRPRGRQARLAAAVVAATTVALATPVAVLVWRSFRTGDGLGLAHYRNLGTLRAGTVAFVPPLEAVRNSLLFGLAAASVAAVVGGAAAVGLHRLGRRGRALADSTLMLPLGTSAVTIGFGFLVALDAPPLDLRTSPVLIPAAQALIAVPFVIRTVLPAIDAVPESLRDTARVLGARPRQVWWWVDAGLVRRPLLVALGFAYAISLGEFGATVFIARADVPTVPVAIYRALGQPGALNLGQAMALSTILLVLTAAVMVVVDRVGDARVGGF